MQKEKNTVGKKGKTNTVLVYKRVLYLHCVIADNVGARYAKEQKSISCLPFMKTVQNNDPFKHSCIGRFIVLF